jgi:hypothetical protein
MKRSHLNVLRFAAACFVIVGAASCESPSAPGDATATLELDSASALHSSSDNACPGKSGGACRISASVLLNAAGKASLIVRTGTYNQATGEHEPDGTFEKVQWKVYDNKGKLKSTSNNSSASGTVFVTPISTTVLANYRVDVEALVRSHTGKKGTAVVRASAAVAYAPDIDLSTETIELLVDGARQPIGTLVPNTPHTFVVDIANLTTFGGTPSTTGIKSLCVVRVDGQLQVMGLTPGFSYAESPLQYVAPGATVPCAFTLALGEGTHTIKVTAVAQDLFFDAAEHNNSTTATVVVGPAAPVGTVDLVLRSIERDLGAGATEPLGEVSARTPASYVARIGALPDAGTATSANASCRVNVVNTRTGQTTISGLAGSVTGTASAAQDALCRFSLTLADNDLTDEQYRIEVSAQPTDATELSAANNSGSADVTAIARADVDLTTVELSVDGVVQADLSSVKQGKTGVFTATIANPSLVFPARVNCAATASAGGSAPASVPLVGSTNPVVVPAGGSATCRFDYTFTQLTVVDFSFTAMPIAPVDTDVANNTVSFSTTVLSDNTFPGIDGSNIFARQQWTIDPATGTPTNLNEQKAHIRQITLAFANATGVIGDFTLAGKITTGGRTLSQATWTVQDLMSAPLNTPSCRNGVDANPTTVNNHVVELRICSIGRAGGVQEIFVEYEIRTVTSLMNPQPDHLFADELTFDVRLDWTLAGSSLPDFASALISFGLVESSGAFAHIRVKNHTGLITVIRNGSGT